MADTLTEFGVLGHIFDTVCVNYNGEFVEGFFIAINFWPLFVGCILLGIVIEHTEVFYSAFSWAFFAQTLINWGIRIGVNQSGPEAVCSVSKQLPTLSTDLMTFSTLFLMIMSGFCFDFSIRWYKLLMITIFGPVVIYARVYLKLNTPQQLLWGVLSGFIGFVCWSILIYYVLTRWKTSILYKTFLGTDYIDTLLNTNQPILATNMHPLQIQLKIKDHDLQQKLVDDLLTRRKIALLKRNNYDLTDHESLLSIDFDLIGHNSIVQWVNDISF